MKSISPTARMNKMSDTQKLTVNQVLHRKIQLRMLAAKTGVDAALATQVYDEFGGNLENTIKYLVGTEAGIVGDIAYVKKHMEALPAMVKTAEGVIGEDLRRKDKPQVNLSRHQLNSNQ